MLDKLAKQAKAALGGVLSGLITLAAVAATATGVQDVTFIQWVLVAISTIGVWIGVYSIPNRPAV
ncbi:MAG: hypothetical protein WED09_11900 [Homoserinimonas sp.]